MNDIMLERRRSMLSSELILDSLLFWLDGYSGHEWLKVGDENIWIWNACYTSTSYFQNFSLRSAGTVIPLNNYFTLPNDSGSHGGFYTNKNIFSSIGNGDYTLIIAVSNLEPKKSKNVSEACLWGGALNTKQNEQHQYRFGLDFTVNKGLCSFQKPETTTYFDISTPKKITNGCITYKKEGNNDTLYYDVDGSLIKKTITAKIRRTDSDLNFMLGCYSYAPFSVNSTYPDGENWCDIPGNYHACAFYNRSLSDEEITKVTDFFKQRYNLI